MSRTPYEVLRAALRVFACFAFMLDGDNIETILVLDAEGTDEQAEWVFACLPMTIRGQALHLDGDVVWERRAITIRDAMRFTEPFAIHRRPVAPDERLAVR